MKISADYISYNDVLESSVIKIADDKTLTITPIEKEIVVDEKTIKEYKVEFNYKDTTESYDNTYEYSRQELKQFIKLLQDIQSQIQQEASKNTSGNCCGK